MKSLVAFSFLVLACLPFALRAQSVDPAFQRGAEAFKAGQLDIAATEFSRSIESAPRFAQAYFNLGLVRLQQNRTSDAASLFSKTLQLRPDLRGAHLFLGIAEYRLDRYAEAATALKRAAEMEPNNPEVAMWLGIASLASGDAGPAVSSLEKAAKLKPNDVDVLYHLGRAYMQLSKETYERMYQADPDSWRVHQVLAQSYEEADRMEDAQKECRKAIELRPHERGLHQQLGDIFWKQNRLSEAEAEFQAELQVDPQNLTSMYKLAAVSTEQAKPQVAVDLLSKVLETHPDSREAHYQIGRAEAQLGNNPAAIKDFRAVTSLTGPVEPEIVRQSYYQLAQLYRRSQQPEQARLALDSFKRLKEDSDAQHEAKLNDKMKRASESQAQ